MNKLLIVAAILPLAVFAGCPEDEEPTTTPTPDATSTPDSTAGDTTAGDSTGTPDGTTLPLQNFCMNDDDFALCENATTPGDACPDDRSFAQAAATTCGLGCVGDADPGGCTATCMVNDQGVPISADCGGCYAGTVLCTVNSCLSQCLTDPSSTPCLECQAANCLAAFYACTGFESSCDDGVDENEDGNTDCDDPSCEYDSACTP